MLRLTHKEIYLYGTLLALAEEQGNALLKLQNQNLGFFGKSRLESRLKEIEKFFNKLIESKKKNPNSELQEIPIEIRANSNAAEMIAILSDLQHIKYRNSNLQKVYSSEAWNALESFLKFDLEMPSELQEIRKTKTTKERKKNITGKSYFKKKQEEIRWNMLSIKGELEQTALPRRTYERKLDSLKESLKKEKTKLAKAKGKVKTKIQDEICKYEVDITSKKKEIINNKKEYKELTITLEEEEKTLNRLIILKNLKEQYERGDIDLDYHNHVLNLMYEDSYEDKNVSLDDLRQLDEMRDDGLITQDLYNKLERKIIKNIL
jgi:hypothetical protein